jgi:hypothetical protein
MEGEGGCGGDVVVSLGGRWGLEILMNYDQRLACECILVVCSKRELHTLYLCNEHCRQHRTAIPTDVQQRPDFFQHKSQLHAQNQVLEASLVSAIAYKPSQSRAICSRGL